ncbi:MAG: hypothetical protein PVF96_02425 [Candidatus Bathyarchaeota archaeon]|jgi:hypothetical protein
MDSEEEPQENVEETYVEGGIVEIIEEPQIEPREAYVIEGPEPQQIEIQDREPPSHFQPENQNEEGNRFVHGLSVGLGIGCIATFLIMWITIFFTPRLPESITYEAMLSVFIYPIIYLLAVGLIALTAGIVKEYYSGKRNF